MEKTDRVLLIVVQKSYRYCGIISLLLFLKRAYSCNPKTNTGLFHIVWFFAHFTN